MGGGIGGTTVVLLTWVTSGKLIKLDSTRSVFTIQVYYYYQN